MLACYISRSFGECEAVGAVKIDIAVLASRTKLRDAGSAVSSLRLGSIPSRGLQCKSWSSQAQEGTSVCAAGLHLLANPKRRVSG